MSDPLDALAGLNDVQREAATAVRGPVAILAGAGTGKTTTVTRRIAYQVATGTFPAERILAVTFTTKAAGELRQRLAGLGVRGVDARTFHSAALAQLQWQWTRHTGEDLPRLLDHKAGVLGPLARALPMPYRFVPRREVAQEIEWAKNRRISPGRYLASLEGHTPPIPPDLMHRLYVGYERRKAAMGGMDFEDMLASAVRLLEEHPDAALEIRERFHAFTVDEFQDVRRFPDATVVTLQESYRSSPQVLALANGLARGLGGKLRQLTAVQPDGPLPGAQMLADEEAETAAIVDAVRRLHGEASVPLEEIAILYRINARSEPFEEAFAAAGIPYQVKDGAFLQRPGPKAAVAMLRRGAGTASVADAVERVTTELGYLAAEAPDADEEEVTRWSDLGRLRAMAGEFAAAHPAGDVGGFLEELTHRFSVERDGRGVNLLTYHRAKGLEFDAVFLPRLVDGDLPFRSGRAKADPQEERRLLYVGITRARRYLFLTWSREGRSKPSPFLTELGLGARRLGGASLELARPRPPRVRRPPSLREGPHRRCRRGS